MNRGRVALLLMLAVSLAVIAGGWFVMNKMFEEKEGSILGRKGQITIQSAGKGESENENATVIEKGEKSFTGRKLSEKEMVKVLKIWEAGGKEILHEPLEGQMNMEQAVAKGREWISSMGKNEILFSTATVKEFDKITAKLCTYDDKTDNGKEMISFWEINFLNADIQIIFRIHAMSGEVWSAEISTEEKNVSFQNSEGELLATSFPFFSVESSRLYRANNIVYIQNSTGSLYLMVKTSEIMINNRPSTVTFKLWLGTKIENK